MDRLTLTDAPMMGTREVEAPRPKFPPDDGFQAEVGRRVAAYFRETGKRERDCWSMYLKTAAILA